MDKAKVVVNERTGTVVIGADVKLLPAAVAHGNITVTVSTTMMFLSRTVSPTVQPSGLKTLIFRLIKLREA